jgi:PIF1-like helicase/Helix-turn-helix domain/HRDC domain
MQTDTTNINFQIATDFVQFTNRSIFLTGKAGTGKTTFLKHIKEHSNKQIAVVAPTGVAAINAGGVTIHSFFQLPFTPYIPAKNGFNNGSEMATDKHQLLAKVKLNKERIGVIQKLELLIIDEISMVRCDVLDAIDQVLRHYRSQHHKPFGGLQVLLIGDMFQLPPVAQQTEWQILNQYYASPYFFDSMVIKECEPAYIELNKIYRQDDETFISLLNKIRNNDLDEDAFELLQTLYNPNFQPNKEDGYITLTTHNARADAINAEALNSLTNGSFFYKAVVENDFPEKMFPIDEVLEFKLGSQVMFTKNDLDKSKRYFNGKIGTIEKINNEEIYVKCSDSNDLIKVDKYTWENIRYALNPQKQQVEEEVIGTFVQYPLRLAWAITIHKSQGLTFDKAIIDAGKAFAPGQVYVALSRCRSLKGVVLASKIGSTNLFNDEHIKNFSKHYKSNQLESSLQFEKHLHQNNVLQDIFSYENEIKTINKLEKFVAEQRTSFNNSAIVFLNQLKEKLEKYNKIGLGFNRELASLNDNTILPEGNATLQHRFIKAATWFVAELQNTTAFINTSSALTDNKDNAKNYDVLLKEIYTATNFKQHLLQNLANGFDYTLYQKCKKELVVSGFIVSSNSKKTTSGFRHATHPILYDELRDLRNEIAEQANDEIFMIAGNKTLDELAMYLPHTKTELNQISGFGATKIKNYGNAFLQIIIDYCREHNLVSLINEKEKSKKTKVKNIDDNFTIEDNQPKEKKIDKPTTFEESYKLFKEGKTIAEIAAQRSMVVGTIESHLTKYILNGSLAVTEFMPIEKVSIVIKALNEFEKGTSITPIKEQLGNDYSFGEIRMVIAHLDFINSKVE